MSVLFVCHGNICRSVMAEMIFKHLTNNKIKCASRATSLEEIGNDIYPPIKKVLEKNNIKYTKHSAKQITKEEYDEYDLVLVMDYNNIRNLEYIIGYNLDKVKLLKSYINEDTEIIDPWYSRDFDTCYKEIYKCIEALIKTL